MLPVLIMLELMIVTLCWLKQLMQSPPTRATSLSLVLLTWKSWKMLRSVWVYRGVRISTAGPAIQLPVVASRDSGTNLPRPSTNTGAPCTLR